MDKIDKAIITLNDSTSASPGLTLVVDARCQILMTLVFLGFMLSVPLDNLEQLVWFAVYPILWSTLCGTSFTQVFMRSLIVLPFIAFIGVFNPLFDHAVVFTVGDVAITRGWITFCSIILRGLLSVQAVLLLIVNVGFVPMCRALGSMGLPGFMETQLMLVYRYMIVLLEELRTMQRAREARGMGRKLSLKMWGIMIGQLFVRTVNRAERIHKAMLARGFSGTIRFAAMPAQITARDMAITAAWCVAFALLRFINISNLLSL